MPYAKEEGFYENGRFIGRTIPEAKRALDPQTYTRLVREYIPLIWDINDVARWISDGYRIPTADDVAYFALAYIKENHGYEPSGRPLAGVSYRVVDRSENIAPRKMSKPKASSGRTPAKKSANRAPARRY